MFPLPFLLSTLLPLTTASCYWPNGQDRNAAYNASANGTLTIDYYQPCAILTPGLSASMCCAAGNTCQSNGLCWSSGAGLYWRESCSDSSWESQGCVKLFVNGTGSSDDIVITECPDGSFCYANQNLDCCAAGEGVYIVDGNQESHDFNSSATTAISSSSTASTAASKTQAPTTTTTSAVTSGTPVPAPTTSTSTVPSLSASAKAGIGAGIAVLALLTLGVAAWFLVRRRRRRNRASPYATNQLSPSAPEEEEKETWKRHEVHSDEYMVARPEMDGEGVGGQPRRLGEWVGVAELGGEVQRRELPVGRM